MVVEVSVVVVKMVAVLVVLKMVGMLEVGVVVEMVVVVILEVRGGSGCGGEGNLIVYVLLLTSSIVFRYV